jgi:NNP family nitrate/nitrite transporter-like MFS transporter
MVSIPSLAGAFLRIALGLLVDRIGAKNTGIIAQLVVIAGLTFAWMVGLRSFEALALMGFVLGIAGASFAVALPQCGRWYPPHMQGTVMGLAGAGNIGVVIDSLLAPRLAKAYGWNSVFGFALIPAILALIAYVVVSKEPPLKVKPKSLKDYLGLLRDKDTHWFCFFYTVTFGGFSGLAYSLVMYFGDVYSLTKVGAGDFAAGCIAIGALARPIGGSFADKFGGIRALNVCYVVAGLALASSTLAHSIWASASAFFVASAFFGMGNGSIFQLLPQRFSKDIGAMSGLVGVLLATGLGSSKAWSGSYVPGFLGFSSLCVVALIGLNLVKGRWRTTWGTLVTARI